MVGNMDAAEMAAVSLRKASASTIDMGISTKTRSNLIARSRATPRTTQARIEASRDDQPIDLASLLQDTSPSTTDTVLYLGYGSNLSAETFLRKRNIKPLSQANVVVPSIALTFNLPGIPYNEPCFANSRYRDEDDSTTKEGTSEYHKDRWHKGLVGVVYEVTKSDYAHIIATEGGGSGYQDVVVPCYTLSSNPKDAVPLHPSGTHGKAHTLLAPQTKLRSDPSYAQPSARYLKLITDGAAEHALPYEYQDFLHQIRTYHPTTTKQRLGSFIFLSIWAPILFFMFQGPASIFLRPDGTYPPWFAAFSRAVFTGCWGSYDHFFKPMFGDGERTTKETDEDGRLSEKAPLVRESIERYGINGRLETM
jgi:hypothetical protein